MNRPPVVGALRPSQLLHSFGIGAVVDLPNLSTMVLGLDDWKQAYCREISEPRLLAAVRRQLGEQVERLIAPPAPTPTVITSRVSEDVGLPVAVFPRWFRCPACNFLAPFNCGLFLLKPDLYRPERTRYVHVNCAHGREPTVIPARFLTACEHGHLDDFPWSWFVHGGSSGCMANLELEEMSISGEAASIEVRCTACGAKRRMAEAVGEENRRLNMPQCRGRRPHLKDFEEEGCRLQMKTVVLGASNLWFGVSLSALSLPVSGQLLEQLVEENWATLTQLASPSELNLLRRLNQLGVLSRYEDAEIWEIIERRRHPVAVESGEAVEDLKGPEWTLLTHPDEVPAGTDFKVLAVLPPQAHRRWLRQVVLVERLREVSALLGFSRIESLTDYGVPLDETERAPMSRNAPTAAPAGEVRGEGLFLHLDEATLSSWLQQGATAEFNLQFYNAHRRWRTQRGMQSPDAGYPGARFVLLHSLSHALMRQLVLECGYSAASIRERIYAREADSPGGPMAGLLLYTAAPDSEGTLGGLVRLGRPAELGRHLDAALSSMGLCASDPLCAEHHPFEPRVTLHGAACHACLFAPETSCEAGNRYLDRTILVPTVKHPERAFFALTTDGRD